MTSSTGRSGAATVIKDATTSGELRFDGRVAIVTGGGRGLGRSHALLLGQRGAAVVVNDVGASVDGESASAAPAESVAAEIRAAGGRAIANAADIGDPAGAEALVAQALGKFGQVDILINNAGTLRDKSFAKMDLDDFRSVLDVHLMGTVQATRAVWPHMLEQGYGRVVVTSSHAGLYGNFGQTNYAAAKLGVIGLMNTLKLEGRQRGVLVNAITPLARTRMAENTPLDAFDETLSPEAVSAVVAWLVHERFKQTGLIVSAGGGYVSQVQIVEGEGAMVDDTAPEAVARVWDEAMNMDASASYEDATALLRCLLARKQAER